MSWEDPSRPPQRPDEPSDTAADEWLPESDRAPQDEPVAGGEPRTEDEPRLPDEESRLDEERLPDEESRLDEERLPDDESPLPDAIALTVPEPAPRRPGGLARTRVIVDAPASSANLGAGYDTLAMALEIKDRIEVEALFEPGVEIVVEGEGAGELPTDASNRFVVALETGLRWALGEVPTGLGWRIRMQNQIPLARGLGSSAAATVAGLLAADALTGGTLDQRRLLALAIEIEGHPDNAAAALLGGFVVVGIVDGKPETVRFDPPRQLRVVLFVPEASLATSTMRAALPHDVPLRDAVFNLGRVALGVAGLATGRYDLLRVSTEDRLHEQYRARIYPALPSLLEAAREAGAIGACLSGAGSSVICFGDSVRLLSRIEGALAAAAVEADVPGAVQIVAPRSAGAVVIEVR